MRKASGSRRLKTLEVGDDERKGVVFCSAEHKVKLHQAIDSSQNSKDCKLARRILGTLRAR